jgi:folate-binding protein YgfZ
MTHYEIAHRAVGMTDRSMYGTLQVAGTDRATWLQGLLTNDIKAVVPGQGCYAAWLTPQGRMITDMRVLELGERIELDVLASNAAELARRLDQLVFVEDVQIKDVTGARGQIRVIGPAAATVVAATLAEMTGRSPVGGSELAQWIEYQNAVIPFADAELRVVRDEGLGVPAYDICSTVGAQVRRVLAHFGAVPLDEPTIEALRIEAGRPLFGVDMNTDTIPLEAGIENRAISFSKGCYVGQEVIVRVVSRGHGRVARKLVGLVLDGTRVPEPSESIVANGRETGYVTSATQSPALSRPIALGYVHRGFAEPGTRVTIGGESGESATVTQLPFVTSPPAL